MLSLATFRPNDLQSALIDVVASSMSAAMQCGMGSGKTTGLALAAHVIGITRPGMYGLWFAEKSTAQSTSAQPIAEVVLGNMGWRYRSHQEYKYWENRSTDFRWYMRAYNPDKGQDAQKAAAQGSTTTAIIADECQDIQARFWRFARGRNRQKGPNGEPAIYIFSGLPHLRAWWVRVAEEANLAAEKKGRAQRFAVLKYTSLINAANLTDEFFDDFEGDAGDFKQFILNEPEPEEGLVWPEWSDATWPEGNIVRGWKYDPSRHTVRLAIDFGRRHPAVLFIASEDDKNLDVVFDELAPDNVDIDHLVHLILRKGWPRAHAASRPSDVAVLIDTASGDPMGTVQKGQTGTNIGEDAVHYLRRPPGNGGIGVNIRYTWDKAKRDIAAGIRRTARRIRGVDGARTLACTEECWKRGMQGKERRTFARMICELGYEPGNNIYGKGEKAGEHDHIADALRYDTMTFAWIDGRGQQAARDAFEALKGLPPPAHSLIRQLGR